MQKPMCYGYMFHNYQHAVRTISASGTGQTADIVYLYCTQCGDVNEIGEEDE